MESENWTHLENPCQSAGWISKIFFGWSIPIFKKTYHKILHPNDAFEPLHEDRSDTLGDRLEKHWVVENSHSRPSLLRALFKTFWCEIFMLGMVYFFTHCACKILNLFLLKRLLSFFREQPGISHIDASYCGIGFVFLTICSGIGSLHYFFNSYCYGMKIRVAISSLIYRKTLRLSQRALYNTATGKLVNLLSNDIKRFETLTFLHPLWLSPLLLTISAYILLNEIGWAAVIGLTIIFLIVPIQSYVGKLLAKVRFDTALRTDERVRFMDEIVCGVQVIKMYGWQESFCKLITAARNSELKKITETLYIKVFNLTIFLFSTRIAVFCTVLSFISFYGSNSISIPKMFMISYLFNIISITMCTTFIRAMSEMNECIVVLRRLQMFLEYEEKSESKNESMSISSDELNAQNLAISMRNVTVEWSSAGNQIDCKQSASYKNEIEVEKCECEPFRLQNINLEVQKGKLIFVVGSVGSGKSTLMQVLLKELPVIFGSMGINGTVSYASQVNWTFTSTIRQNIIFGQPMERTRYNRIIKCTALTKDFEQFSNGDKTLVGENGAGLSGGQKARINLARSIYRQADIYLIDDPLSAVDTHVQSHLFNKCIGPYGFLARQNATRILITHQLQFMKEADWIVVLKNGKIEIQGDYFTILTNGIDFSSMLKQNENDQAERGNRSEDFRLNRRSMSIISQRSRSGSMGCSNEEEYIDDDFEEENALTKELEATSKGRTKGPLLLNYLKSSNIPYAQILLCTLSVVTQAFASTAEVWVQYWIRNKDSSVWFSQSKIDEIWPTERYVYIYAGIIIALILAATIRSGIYILVCSMASRNMHAKMFHALISTKIKFFNENPVGRIMNRFTKDLGSIDEILPITLLEAAQQNLVMIGAIVVIIYTKIKLSILIIMIGVVFFIIRKLYLKCATNIMRLEGITKSPVFTHISATLNGLSVVRAFQAEKILQDEFERHQNLNTGTWFMFLGAQHGFGILLDMLVYIFTAIVVYVFLYSSAKIEKGDKVGLAIAQVLNLIGNLQYAVIQSADVANQLTSVERVLDYSQLEPETQPQIPQKVSVDWPSMGKIEFKNVYYRYSTNDDPVLRGLSFSVWPKEKVSIVGRTGAGKSSLISAIFRLAIVDGDILLDDVNTSSIDLNLLRSRISIIPQEPTLFSGTLRRNLDPFDEYSDDDIWSAINSVELNEFISKSNGLQMPVVAYGQNFSTGQRQMVCLVRAILKKSRIIILDEATANVDLRTDEIIQKTIREKFCNSTVITVAHRLNTVIDSDRVLVMDAGVAIEFDIPYLLLEKEEGTFHKLARELGQQEYEHLLLKAKDKYENIRNENNHIWFESHNQNDIAIEG